jgi:hypothetical protein
MGLVHGQDLSSQVIGLPIEVHRRLGPGLLEWAYEDAFATNWRMRISTSRANGHFPLSTRMRVWTAGIGSIFSWTSA